MESGSRYGRYELLSRIAMGGMAEIFLSRETGLAGFERLVIIKRVLPSLAEDIDFIDMFLDEARLAARLTHPNIVHIYELGEEQGSYYIAMEYVPGGDLHQMLGRRQGRLLPLTDSLHIIGEVCAGLQFAHALAGPDGELLGVVHRDVTPKNVLLSVDGVIKIVDFGIAKARAKLSVTRPGDIKGTFSYMAPEQARGEDVDRRADIYAVGALTYRLVTGTPAFPQVGDSLLSAVRSSQFVRPRKINPELPPAIEDIILRAMALDPRDRYPTCGALRRDLAEVARQMGLHGDAESIGAAVRESFPQVPGVTAPIDPPAQPAVPSSTAVETPVREAMALASPDEATGLVSLDEANIEDLTDDLSSGLYEELSPFDPMESEQTDMVMLPEAQYERSHPEDFTDDPTNILVPDEYGRPTPSPASPFADFFDPPTEPSEPPSAVAAGPVGPLPPSAAPPPAAQQPPAVQPHDLGALASGSPAGVFDGGYDAGYDAGYGGYAPPAQQPQPPSGYAELPSVGAVEPAATPTGTDVVRPRRKKKPQSSPRSKKGLFLIIGGFVLGVFFIVGALILVFLPSPSTQANATAADRDAGATLDPSLASATPENEAASLASSPPPPEPEVPDEPDASTAEEPPPEEPPPDEEEDDPPVEEEEEEAPTKLATPRPRDPPPRRSSPPRTSSRPQRSTTKTARSTRPSARSTSTSRRSSSSSSSTGFLTVFTMPSSKVYLGGRLLGNSPIAKRQVPAGRHTLKLVAPSGDKTVRVTVKAGEHARVRQRL